jgi:hypothetical protein
MDFYYECIACKKFERTPASLNKHIDNCKEYTTFIKTYKPINYVSCSKCGTYYTTKDNLKNHTCSGSR